MAEPWDDPPSMTYSFFFPILSFRERTHPKKKQASSGAKSWTSLVPDGDWKISGQMGGEAGWKRVLGCPRKLGSMVSTLVTTYL